MASKYNILFGITITHSYFPDEIARGFSLVPDDATRHLMLRLGLVFRSSGNRFSVFFDAQFAGNSRLREEVLMNTATLVFHLSNNDALFLNYTGNIEPVNMSKAVFLFSNLTGGGELRDGLINAQAVSTADMITTDQMEEPAFTKPFGQVRVRLHAGLHELLTIPFQSKATFWRYILTSEHLKTLVNPAIIHKDTKQAFLGPEVLVLPDQREALVFRSATPVQMSALPNKSFQLLENYEPVSGRGRVIMNMMPNPNNSTINLLPGSGTEKLNYSEIFL